VSGEIKLFRNGPNDSILVVFTDDYRTYIVKHLHFVAVKKTLVGMSRHYTSLISDKTSQFKNFIV